jgi:hypothetical protein
LVQKQQCLRRIISNIQGYQEKKKKREKKEKKERRKMKIMEKECTIMA